MSEHKCIHGINSSFCLDCIEDAKRRGNKGMRVQILASTHTGEQQSDYLYLLSDEVRERYLSTRRKAP